MGKIIKMSPHLANMIAAGEVVEKPASVVKELVENAIDAHARNISVYLKNGGIDEIKVIDDGDGMEPEDVVMAFAPHATSKIRTEYDLFRIMTLGFRGEAVASIAAVSTMDITSSQNGVEGYHCAYKAGVMQSEGITHSNKGTTVTVSGLFFNTPARLKYLKAPKSELASVSFWMDKIAMAHPDLRFSLYSDERLVVQTTGSSSDASLIGEIYGFEAAKNVMKTDYVADGYTAKLVFVKPSIYRSNKLEITLICNGRYVKNYNITNAVIEGFDTFLPIGKYPIGIVYLDIDPLLVDVNVHPAKTEVKISSEDKICAKLVDAIKKMLSREILIPTREVEQNENQAYHRQTIFEYKAINASAIHDNPVNEAREYYQKKYHSQPSNLSENISINQYNAEINNTFDEYVNNEPAKEVEKEEIIHEERKIPYMEYVGSVFGTYLIFQADEGMFIIDQHAAAERVNFEKYYAILGNPKQPVSALLVPVMLSFTKDEAMFVEDNLDKFKEIGFTMDQVNECDFAVREIPLWAHLDDVDGLIFEIIDLMVKNHKIDIISFREHIAASTACKASIKANHALSRIEIDALLANLNKCKNPYTCPHGRPSIIKITAAELEKMFERIQK